MHHSPKTDQQFLRRALDLASRGIALAAPNPRVGAVIVDRGGQVAGEGFHTYDGIKHAEVLALEQAGERAKDSTVYLNLEPCSHQGRTGPCADALIAAGARRVVASMSDPNPQVSGQGFARLRAAGIEVEVGGLDAEARKLNEFFAKFIRTGDPLVTLKSAMTLDGKIAPGGSNSAQAMAAPSWITGEAARAHVQELRHQSDAILVGVGTVLADDPLLTDRTGKPRRRPLLRVVLDSRLRIPLESRIVKTAEDDVLVLYSTAEEKRKRQLEDSGVKVEQIPQADVTGRPRMPAVVGLLGKMQITSLLIEGGSRVNWSALESGIVDKVFLYYAPRILGAVSSVPFAAGEGFAGMQDAAHVKSVSLHRFGEDFAVEGYLRNPYE